jgi:hypothetical protein
MSFNSLADLLEAHLVNYKPNIWWMNHFEVECSSAHRHISELDSHAKLFYGREAGVAYTVEETYKDEVAGAVLRISFNPRINAKYDIECLMTPETITMPAVGKGSPFVFRATDHESEESIRLLSELSRSAFRFFVDVSGLKPIRN